MTLVATCIAARVIFILATCSLNVALMYQYRPKTHIKTTTYSVETVSSLKNLDIRRSCFNLLEHITSFTNPIPGGLQIG